MKAGNAGSSPDGVTIAVDTTKRTNTSFALETFLREVGDAVFSLNTVAVGLDAVEKGHEKPASLHISWNPVDRIAAARKTRKFTLESVLVHVSEALNQYVHALSRLPRFVQIREHWFKKGADDSAARKLADIATEILGEKEYLVASAALLIHWRNRIVHRGSNAKLKHEQKMLLHKCEDDIWESYAALSVDCLFCHFEEQRPTLKDVTTLISMSIRMVRRMDAEIYKSFGEDDLRAWLDHYGISPMLKRVISETKPEKRKDAIRRVFLTHAPQLLESFERIGLKIDGEGHVA